ncbi:MAG: hypothetical protein QOG34_1727 [Frankiaceae bacterium]|nr:hypothetical protein [Frankiaceae bacterium]
MNAGQGSVVVTPLQPGVVQQAPAAANASSTCKANNGDVIVDTTNAGVHTSIYTYQPSTLSLDVCFRAESGTVGVGGLLTVGYVAPGFTVTGVGLPTIVPPSVSSAIPSVDGHSSYCTSPPSGTRANTIPLPHPLSSGIGPGGTTWMLDAYSDGATTVWVCLQINAVSTRVVVPLQGVTVTPPSVGAGLPVIGVSPGYAVSFTPDGGTP